MSEKVDVLWLFEHVARELDVACVVQSFMKQRYGLRVEIRNLYGDIHEYLSRFNPTVVVHPFVYFIKGAPATEEVFARWPNAVHFNMAWEQIHYPAHQTIKAPNGKIPQKKVLHHAWGEFYREFLMSHGVPQEKIFVNGHPSYQLYADPYRLHFMDRNKLATRHGLNTAKKWVFVPENYRWAFAKNKIPLFESMGGRRDEMERMVEFSIPSMAALLKYCRTLAEHDNVEVIFRPRPSLSSDALNKFILEHVGDGLGRIRLIKDESVREWVLASDHVVSSYSTTLLEAAFAGKPAWMFEPIPIPKELWCSWYDQAPRIKGAEDLLQSDGNAQSLSSVETLRGWVKKNLMGCGDPLQRLALHLCLLVQSARTQNSLGKLPKNSSSKAYFNPDSHEGDALSIQELNSRSQSWSKDLEGFSFPVSLLGDWTSNEVLSRTMDRNDLSSSEAAPLVKALNLLIRQMAQKGVSPSSWVGTFPNSQKTLDKMKSNSTWSEKIYASLFGGNPERPALVRGVKQRLKYKALSEAADDVRFPWFLYWEIFAVLRKMGSLLKPGMRLFDGGGAASLFTCYMASQGFDIHSVDLNERLLAYGEKIGRTMEWNNMHTYHMDMRALSFPDEFFDHAFSICVFEHLDFDIKQAALKEIARTLKPGGVLSLTFDYRNPAPGVVGYGKDPRPRNALKTEGDIYRNFLSTGHFRMLGRPIFSENWKSYLRHPLYDGKPYTFGVAFLEKVPVTSLSDSPLKMENSRIYVN